MKHTSIHTPLLSQSNFQSSFFGIAKSTCFLLILFLILHLFWASQWPLLNDESYYWDWARNLQLSYVDAPPAISWVAAISAFFVKSGVLSARIAVPFLNFFTAIFLIKSADILSPSHSNPSLEISRFRPPRDHGWSEAADFQGWRASRLSNIVVLLFATIPIFNINGILLMPDAPLLFASAGVLYFALRCCENIVYENKANFSLIHGIALGCFLGLCIDSKYQGVPLSIGIFLALVCIRGVQKTLQKDILFWITTIFAACVVASPLFIWNLQNNFASFKFQGQHGFSTWNLNIVNFSIYMISVFGILLPWYSYLFLKQAVSSLKQKHFFQSLDVIPIFAALSIFIFIGSAALGKKTQVHWITPSALFLIPLVAAHWNSLTSRHVRFWKNINIISVVSIICITTFVFTRPVQNFLSQEKFLGIKMPKIHKGLYGNLLWSNMAEANTNFQKQIPEIVPAEKNYFKNLTEVKCSLEPYIAGFNWRWTSQFAFYLNNKPRVFSFDLKRSTYYSWRDSLPDIAGCHFFVIGPKSMYKEEELGQLMYVQSTKEFTIPQDYTNVPMDMILVEGTMKDARILDEISSKLLQNVRY